jgi:Rap1a immunity proteins
MLRRLALVMSVLVLGASYCLGQTSKSMLAQCREVVAHEKTPGPFPPDKVLSATACTNYIYGFVGGYLGTLQLVGAKGQICFPTGATPVQLATAYVNWGDHNLEKTQLPARATIMRAFEEAFPCTK